MYNLNDAMYAAKVLNVNLNDISMVVTDEAIKQEEKVLQNQQIITALFS